MPARRLARPVAAHPLPAWGCEQRSKIQERCAEVVYHTTNACLSVDLPLAKGILMNSQSNELSRRELMKQSGQVAVASALAGLAVPAVHAGGDETIKVALVGCGGRGTG